MTSFDSMDDYVMVYVLDYAASNIPRPHPTDMNRNTTDMKE